MSSSPNAGQLPALGEYDLLAPIGRGGMAQVHAARLRAQPDRLVALKVIRPELGREQGFVAMFLDEARIASRLSHPNIVSIYGLGHDAGHHYLAMELLRGRTLLETWTAANAQKKRIPFVMAAWICARVADALHHAHELRDETGAPALVVHRDVNPSNVFLCMSGEPKVIDFGLAKARDRIAATAIGVVKGKLAYLSPEQVAGKPIDRRSDIFSLGVTLWEITLDRRLFREDSDVATVRRVMAADVPDPVTILPDYPPALAAIVRRALEADPMRRFASGEELARALDGYVAEAGGCDARTVAAFLAGVFPPSSALPWEAEIFEGPRSGAPNAPAGNVQVWDEGEQKMTWMAAVAETVGGQVGLVPAEQAPARSRSEEIEAALAGRIAALQGEPAALANAYLERSLVDELGGDREAAVAQAEQALAAFESPAAHAALRRLLHAHGAEALLPHQEAALMAAVGNAAMADRWAERGRLLRAAKREEAEVAGAFERALALVPDHPAALKGLEAELRRRGDAGALAAHLARMAGAYRDDAELAAWLHVERAELLDTADASAARAALTEALALDAKQGPVREACVRHAARHRNWRWLAELLEDEAGLEKDPARAAALELEAACIHRLALRENDRALTLLERAALRAPTDPRLDARVAEDLVLIAPQAPATARERAERGLAARRRRLAFVTGAAARASELRAIAALEESRGEMDAAVAALQQARAADPTDARAAESLDRLLAAGARTRERVALHVEEAARARTEIERGRRLLRASALAESLGDAARAVELGRAALVAVPGDPGAIDALARLFGTSKTEALVDEARAKIALHAHAAEHAADAERRLAHLETVALLTEELLGDEALAVSAYEAILALAPRRRSAILGLARAARRAGDRDRYVRALQGEAALADEVSFADRLRAEAAEALVEGGAPADGDRALALVSEILGRDPAHAAARRLEQRIHEAAGRWGLVDRSLAAQIAVARSPEAKGELLALRAEILRTHLGDPAAALEALQEAFRLAPSRDDLRLAIVSVLAGQGDVRALRDGLLGIAEARVGSEEAREALVRAAEIDALALGDDDSAMKLLDRALQIDPEDPMVRTRRARIEARQASRFAAAPENAAEPGNGRAPHALRALENEARTAGSHPHLANALSAQADASRGTAARLGALHELCDLMEWSLPPSDPTPVLDAILALAPDDVAAREGRTRVAMEAIAQGGTAHPHLEALRMRAQQEADRTERHLARLTLAWVLDPEEGGDDESRKEALRVYAAALEDEPRSALAAVGAARLGARFQDDAAFIAGATALADAAPGAERAIRLTHGAGKVLSSRDGRLGDPAIRLARALDGLEKALEADPDCVPALALLVATRAEESQRDRLLAILRHALERATTPKATVSLGLELARVARLAPPDRVLAIDALKRVVAAAPDHASAWRALADLSKEQGAPGEAVAALESLVAEVREPRARLEALFELASLYRERVGGAADMERVLRAALDTDPTSERAVRELLAIRRAQASSEEITTLLGRLKDAVQNPEAKATVLGELADAHLGAGDAAAAESALVEALATAPNAARLGRLLELHTAKPSEQARVLAAAVAQGEASGRADPATLVRLGRLEIEVLGRPADGVAHLRRALALAPTMHEARAALARGLTDAKGAAEAIATIASMMVPDAAPLLALPDPASALATLERAFTADGQPDEALVTRELRVVGGGLDDAAHVELRARRLSPGVLEKDGRALERATLLAAVAPADTAGLPLALAHALEGVEGKLIRTDLDALGVTARSRLTPDAPLWPLQAALASALGLETPPLALADRTSTPRVALVEGEAWVVAPAALAALSPPEQITALARPLVRIALGVPWLDDLGARDAHALLVAAARRVAHDYPLGAGGDFGERVEAMTRALARAVGALAFKQKKALADLAGRLTSEPPIDAARTSAFALAVARTELRAAFLLSGDLLATLDALRATDPAFLRETERVGPRALAATLVHPLAADVVRFALSRQTTALRRRLGTAWIQ